MNHTKTNIQNEAHSRKSIYVLATIAIVSSFALWTGILTQISLQSFLGSSIVLPPLPYFDFAKYTRQEVALAPRSVFSVANNFSSFTDSDDNVYDSLHSAPEELPNVTTFAETKEKVVYQSFDPLSVDTLQSQGSQNLYNRKNLRQWDLKSAYTLSIPKIGVRTNVLLPSIENWTNKNWDALEQQMQVGLNNGAVAYPHSPTLGSPGTLIVAGHSSPPTVESRRSGHGNLFARLPELEYGDTFTVSAANGVTMTYMLQSTEVVSPSDTSILIQQQDEELLKLITCYPVGTTKERWIVTAKRVL